MKSISTKTYNKPDFICVGLHKCGTSWLNHHLNQHPEIRNPIIKELRFFLEGERIPAYNLNNLLFSKHWHYKSMRRLIPKRFFPNNKLRRNGLRKMLRYYLKPHTIDWYSRNFYATHISGDVTPGYYLISDERLAEIQRHFPNVKIILMLRDPISRLWSNYKMNLTNQGRLRELTGVSINDAKIQNIIIPALSYADIIKRWESGFNKIGVFYYDDIKSNPQRLLQDIYNFIGCKDPEFCNSNLSEVVNPGQKTPIPRKLERDLAGIFLPEVEKLAEYTDHEIPKRWVIEYKEILSKNTED